MIVSHHHAMLFVTFAAVLICVVWGARDVYLLFRNLSAAGRARWSDHRAWRDQVFGSVVGVVIIGLGIYGIIRYWTTH